MLRQAEWIRERYAVSVRKAIELGQAQVIVREIGPDAVTVDGNHPLT